MGQHPTSFDHSSTLTRRWNHEASLFYGHQTRIVLSRCRIFDILFEVGERFRIRKACGAKEFEVPANLEAPWLIFPNRSVRLYEIPVDEHAAVERVS